MGVIYCKRCHRKIVISPYIKLKGKLKMSCIFCGGDVVVTKKELINTVRNVRKKYHRQGCTSMYKCYKNHVFVGANTTLTHLQGVVEICYNLRKQHEDFITEAVPNSGPSRRVDIVNLTNGEEIEIEKTNDFKIGTKNYKVLTQDEYEKLKRKSKTVKQ